MKPFDREPVLLQWKRSDTVSSLLGFGSGGREDRRAYGEGGSSTPLSQHSYKLTERAESGHLLVSSSNRTVGALFMRRGRVSPC